MNHPFEPRAEWWTLCRVCGLAESAHTMRASDPECDVCHGRTLVVIDSWANGRPTQVPCPRCGGAG